MAFFVLFYSRQFLWEVEGVVLGKKCKLVSKLTVYTVKGVPFTLVILYIIKLQLFFLQKVRVSLKIDVLTIKVVPFKIVIDMYILHITIHVCSFGFMIFMNMNDKVASFL